MKKTTIALLSVWAVCIVAGALYTTQKAPDESSFETQSVKRLTWVVPSWVSIISTDEGGSRTEWWNEIPCADIDWDGNWDIDLWSRDKFKELQSAANCECINNPIQVASVPNNYLPYIRVNWEWLVYNTQNREMYCPEGAFVSNNGSDPKTLELLWQCSPEVTDFWWGYKGIVGQWYSLSRFKNVCKEAWCTSDSECNWWFCADYQLARCVMGRSKWNNWISNDPCASINNENDCKNLKVDADGDGTFDDNTQCSWVDEQPGTCKQPSCGDWYVTKWEECDPNSWKFSGNIGCSQWQTCAPAWSKAACTCQFEVIKETVPTPPTRDDWSNDR